MLRFPPPVKLTFPHHRHCLDMTLAVAEALSHQQPTHYVNNINALLLIPLKNFIVSSLFGQKVYIRNSLIRVRQGSSSKTGRGTRTLGVCQTSSRGTREKLCQGRFG